jgi:hypothetical protein
MSRQEAIGQRRPAAQVPTLARGGFKTYSRRTLVILSAAKNLAQLHRRSFAALRMTDCHGFETAFRVSFGLIQSNRRVSGLSEHAGDWCEPLSAQATVALTLQAPTINLTA